MSTLNVGAMAARLGLDPSDFLEKMKGVEGFASGSGQRIAAEMKRTSREGAESLRLIDEALGVHLSRPVTRILTQEFPALAQGLSSILGAGVFSVVAIAGVEAFDKLSEKVEKARKAQEAYRESLDKLTSSFDEMMAGYAKSAAEIGLSGIDKKLFEIDSHSLEKARRQLDELSKVAEDSAKKGAEAGSLWSRSLAAIGDALHVVFTSSATLGVEQTNQQFEELRKQLDAIAIANASSPTKGLAEELKAVQEEARKAAPALAEMNASQMAETDALTGVSFIAGASDKQIAAQQAGLDNLKRLLDLLKANSSDDSARRADAFKEGLAKQQAAMETFFRDVQAGYAKMTPLVNPGEKIVASLEEMRMKADNDFAALAASGANALELRLARQHLDQFVSYWKQKIAEARQDAEIFAAQQNLPNISTTAGAGSLSAIPAATPQLPTLSLAPMLSDLQELQKVQTDANEAWTKAGQVLQSIETPAEKVQTELQILHELLDQGRISLQQYNAAVAQTGEQLTKAGLHARELQEQLEKLEKDSTSAGDGMKAFMTQLQINGGANGKFTFDLLSQGLNGFEDQTVKVLEGGKANWEKYFQSLAAMALKFMETKTISMIASSLTSPPAQQPAGIPGLAGGISLVNGQIPGATGAASMTTAGTTLTTAGTTLSTAGAGLTAAASALTAAAASMSASSAAAGASGAAGGAGGLASFAGFFAGGGDVMPGQDFIAGEEGPELIHAGNAGASVTPNSKLGGSSVYNDFRGTVMSEDLMRRAEAMAAIQHSERRMMSAIPTMQREINLRQRSNH